VLANRSIVVEGAIQATGVDVLADPLELAPPYRVDAVRRSGSTWAVGARRILVVELPVSLLGDELELVWDGHERSSLVGDAPSLVWVPELAELASARFATWVARARRLRITLWEVEIEPL
jgi:hypothetical protein